MTIWWPRRRRPAVRRALGTLPSLVLAGIGSLGLLSLAACTPTADDSKLPPEVPDPKTLKTPAGALELYRAALLQLPGAFDQVMVTGAILTDELAAMRTPFNVVGVYTALDSRQLPAGASTGTAGPGDEAYKRLHRVRAQVREARGFLGAYATDTAQARALRGHLYVVEGYADVLLADLFCSGIPLSTVDFEGDYTLKPGSSTREVYRTAVGLFDSALVLLQDPVPDSALASDSLLLFRQLAAVGKGRALLALGVYDSAAQAVAAVPTAEFRYQISSPILWSMWSFANDLDANTHTNYATAPGVPGVGQHEGGNGLDYVDLPDADPRVGGTALGEGFYGGTYYFPMKYDPFSSTVTFVVADGIEARLIEAEAALQGQLPGGPDWLTILNALRQTVGLADTTDPGTPEARVDLLFRERAFWLYLTAHRQGDLRRLLQLPYGRSAAAVYPAGDGYPGATGVYGTDVVVPVPEAERQLNRLYTGCINTGA